MLEFATLELSAALDLLLDEITGFELELEFTRELDLLDATFTLDTAFTEDDVIAIGLAVTEEVDVVELMLLAVELTFELELNWVSLEAVKLLKDDDDASNVSLDKELLNAVDVEVELLRLGISPSSALLNVLELVDPSPSTPAAPPHAVSMIESIMPQKGSLALFSAEENIFYTIRYLEFCVT